MRRFKSVFFCGFIVSLLLGIGSFSAFAANCDGLPVTGGVIPAGTSTLTDNCVISGTLEIAAGTTVTIDGNGFALDGNSTHLVFQVNGGATLNLDDAIVRNGNGGGLVNQYGTVIITNSTFTNNTGTYGGAISVDGGGTTTVTNSVISNNSATGGGGIRSMGDFTLNNSIVTNNTATLYGGGIYSTDTLTINNSTITSNHSQGGGGGVWNDWIMTINNSTIADNSATNAGGGIHQFNGAQTLDVTNSTIARNSAPTGSGLNAQSGTTTVVASTISGNTGVGIRVTATLNLDNSIVSNNAGGNCTGTLTDNGGNLISAANGTCTGITPVTDADPMLGTFTGVYYPLSTGSPAIDGAPDCAGLTTDQIGTARPQLGACDIGAIEALINPLTGEVILPPTTVPGTPPLNAWNATSSEDRAEAYGVQDNVYATIHMQNGAWQYNAGGIPQELIDYGVIMAIDVWEQGGDQVFDHYEKVCLLGEGRLIYFDATQSPRPMVEITPVTLEDGYTCGWIPNAGTLVLIEPE